MLFTAGEPKSINDDPTSDGGNRRLTSSEVGGHASNIPESVTDTIISTLLMAMVMSTILQALVFYLLGKFRLTRVIQYMPCSVLSGFLACIGYKVINATTHTTTSSVPFHLFLLSLFVHVRVPLLVMCSGHGQGNYGCNWLIPTQVFLQFLFLKVFSFFRQSFRSF